MEEEKEVWGEGDGPRSLSGLLLIYHSLGLPCNTQTKSCSHRAMLTLTATVGLNKSADARLNTVKHTETRNLLLHCNIYLCWLGVGRGSQAAEAWVMLLFYMWPFHTLHCVTHRPVSSSTVLVFHLLVHLNYHGCHFTFRLLHALLVLTFLVPVGLVFLLPFGFLYSFLNCSLIIFSSVIFHITTPPPYSILKCCQQEG